MSTSNMAPQGGLRERKKQETRDALTEAAVRLAIERGLENVLVDDIAAAAGVSARTFNNYFSSKAQAVAARHVDRLAAIASSLRVRDQEEPIWEAIGAAAVSKLSPSDDDLADPGWVAGVKLMTSDPGVQAELLSGSRSAGRELAVVIAERIGVDPDSLYPQMAATVAVMAVLVGLEQWVRADSRAPLGEVLRKAVAQAGMLAEPPRREPWS